MSKKATTGESLIDQLARVDCELYVAEQILENTNQASVWQFNSLGASDALTDRERYAELITMLETASEAADALRDASQQLVKTLRDEKRKLTKAVGSDAVGPAMKKAHDDASAKAQESTKAVKESAAAISVAKPAKAAVKSTAKQQVQAQATV